MSVSSVEELLVPRNDELSVKFDALYGKLRESFDNPGSDAQAFGDSPDEKPDNVLSELRELFHQLLQEKASLEARCRTMQSEAIDRDDRAKLAGFNDLIYGDLVKNDVTLRVECENFVLLRLVARNADEGVIRLDLITFIMQKNREKRAQGKGKGPAQVPRPARISMVVPRALGAGTVVTLGRQSGRKVTG